MLSDVVEDYLKAIYQIQQRDGAPVSTSAIADQLDVTPPTVTSMTGKLENRGFVTREKYSGVELTPEGKTVALEVLRHHRLLETYLTEHLGYDWSEVHAEADILEHHISETFEERIAERLDHPAVDPHGDPIPTAELDAPEEPTATTLDKYDAGDTVIVTRVRDRDTRELRYLSEAGIHPDARLHVLEVAPFGMVTVRPEHRNDAVSLPETVAGAIRVRSVMDTQEAVS